MDQKIPNKKTEIPNIFIESILKTFSTQDQKYSRRNFLVSFELGNSLKRNINFKPTKYLSKF